MSAANERFGWLAAAQRDETSAILREESPRDAVREAAQNAAEFADRVIAIAHAESSPAERPACVKTCASCCYLHTTASVLEVILIAETLGEREGDAGGHALNEHIASHVARTDGLSAEARKRLRLPCPLLVDGECAVYDARPLVCRGWNSLDADRCDADLADPRAGLSAVLNRKQYLAAGQIAQGMADAIHEQGLDARPLDMVRGLAIALARPGSAADWLAGRNPFATAVNATVFAGQPPVGQPGSEGGQCGRP